jgi:hypothetical protein
VEDKNPWVNTRGLVMLGIAAGRVTERACCWFMRMAKTCIMKISIMVDVDCQREKVDLMLRVIN